MLETQTCQQLPDFADGRCHLDTFPATKFHNFLLFSHKTLYVLRSLYVKVSFKLQSIYGGDPPTTSSNLDDSGAHGVYFYMQVNCFRQKRDSLSSSLVVSTSYYIEANRVIVSDVRVAHTQRNSTIKLTKSESTLCRVIEFVHWTKQIFSPKPALGDYSFNPQGVSTLSSVSYFFGSSLIFNGMSSMSGLQKFADKPKRAVSLVGF